MFLVNTCRTQLTVKNGLGVHHGVAEMSGKDINGRAVAADRPRWHKVRPKHCDVARLSSGGTHVSDTKICLAHMFIID